MTRNQLLLLTIAALAAYTPFLTKGVTYDDFVFLDYAERLTKDPTRAVVADYVWQGEILPDLVVFESTHPPFIPYVIKTVRFVVGENLVAMHAVFFIFLWLATLALGDLIARHTRFSPLFALGFTLGPLFLPIATNLMTDAALFAFWFAAITAWDRALAFKRFSPWHVATWVFVMAGLFTAYQALGLLVVLMAMVAFRKRESDGFLWCAAILTPFALWLLAIYLRYDFIPYFAPPRDNVSIATEVHTGLAWENMWLKARVTLLYLGSGAGLFCAWALGLRRRIVLWLSLVGWGAALTAFLFDGSLLGPNLWPLLLFVLGLACVALLWQFVADFRLSESEGAALDAALMISAAGIAVFQIALAAFAAPRYVFVLVGAIILIALRRQTKLAKSAGLGTLLMICTPQVGLGIAVTAADWSYADAQRVENLDLPTDAPIYFVGEKGMKYSAERLGMRYILPGIEDRETVGYLLEPSEIDKIAVPEKLQAQREEIKRFPIHCSLPIRVMNREAGAGFYLHTRGLLPFTFSNNLVEEYVLYRVLHLGNKDWRSTGHQSKPAGEIIAGRPVSQSFVSQHGGLTRLRFMTATHNRQNQGTLVIKLFREGEHGEELVYETTRPTADVADNGFLQLDFDPIAAKDRRFRLELSSPDSSPGNAVTVWTNRNPNLQDVFFLADEKIDGMLVLEAWCIGSDPNP